MTMNLKTLALFAVILAIPSDEAWARQTTPVEPTLFMVTNVVGTRVFMSWVPPASGPAPTAYRLAGGASPSAVAGSLVIPPVPSFEIDLPPGFWHLRVHTIAGPEESGASGEWTVRVGGPAAPTAPADLLGVVNGNSMGLAWRNRFQNGPLVSTLLDVSGLVAVSIPLALTDRFTFDGVPPGTYTFRVRNVNAVGASVASTPVTLTFPGACSGVPSPVTAFIAYTIGNTVFVKWRKAATGIAPTAYLLSVTGTLAGDLPWASRKQAARRRPGPTRCACRRRIPAAPARQPRPRR